MSVVGAFDASCKKCGRKISWRGKLTDRPACVRCGHRPDQAELEAEAQGLAAMFGLATKVGAPLAAMTGPQWRAARESAGLTLGQAATIVGVHTAYLHDVERGVLSAPLMVLARMRDAYAGDPPAPVAVPAIAAAPAHRGPHARPRGGRDHSL